MKVLVISDIHGNCLALDEVLNDSADDRVDQVVCLGDSVQGGPQPAETVARLRALGCHLVMGNADHWMLTGEDSGREEISEDRRRRMEDTRQWSLSQLSSANKDFVRGFAASVRVPLPAGRTLLGYHGSPKSFDDVILPSTEDAAARGMLGPTDDVIMTGGHVHVQFMRHFGRTFHFNPGSAGYAYRHGQTDDDFRVDPFAEYAVLTATEGQVRVEFRRVHYDVSRLVQVYRQCGRPHSAESIAALGF